MANPWDNDRTVSAPWDSDKTVSVSQVRARRDAAKRSRGVNPLERAIVQGVTLGFGDELDAAGAAIETGVANFGRRLTGREVPYSAGEAFNAVVDSERAAQRRFSQERPVQDFASQLVGGALLPGPGWVRNAGTVAQGVRRAGVLGAVAGGGYAAGTAEGNPIDRAPETLGGLALGGLAGAGIQRVAPAISRALGGAPGRQTASRVVNKATGGSRLDPEIEAARRLAAQVDPQRAADEAARLRAAGVEPRIVDVVGVPGQRLVRTAAASPDQAGQLAVDEAARLRNTLKPASIDEAQRLSPYRGTAEELSAALDELENTLSTQYAQPYAEAVTMTPEAIAALRGEAGQEAIQRAIGDAQWRQDYDRIGELQSLLTMDADAQPTISAAALDRVRIAMREMGRNFGRGENANMARASGAAQRVQGIDTALDATPGLAEARENARNIYSAQGILNEPQPSMFNTNPGDYARYLEGLSPQQRLALQVRERQALQNRLGGQRAAGTGTLDQLDSAYAPSNIEALFGDEGRQYLANIGARLEQTRNSARVSPNEGSQTFLRANDATEFAGELVSILGDAAGASRGNLGAGARIADTISRYANTMTPAERETIVRWANSSADELPRILRIAEDAANRGRQPPKVVRDYLGRARGALGVTHPIVQQLETRLIPGAAAAPQTPESEFEEWQ